MSGTPHPRSAAPGTQREGPPSSAVPSGVLPLLGGRDLAAPLAWRHGAAVSGAAFAAACQRLAEQLPATGRAVNLCQDRLQFTLGLAAALARGHTSLLPPNALPATLAQLPSAGPPPYVLADAPAAAAPAPAPHPSLNPSPNPVPAPFPAEAEPAGWPSHWPVVRIDFDRLAAPAAAAAGGARGTLLPIDAALQAVCLLTSGSTGAPQPHSRRFGALVASVQAEAERLAQWLWQPASAARSALPLRGLAIVATVPPQHSYGLESSVLLPLLGGAALHAGRPFYPADIAAALASVPRPRALVTTPFHLKTLLAAGLALPAVDLVLSATAPLSPQLAARAEAAMGGCVGEIYGCTEAGQVAARRTTQGEAWLTLGDLQIRREAPAAHAGSGHAAQDPNGAAAHDGAERYVVQGGHVPEPTALADVLELHDARQFRLLGRANDLIHVAGKRSSLAHLNFQLNRIEGVDDGAFWLPEPGELPGSRTEVETVARPIAFVVAPRLSATQIIGALRHVLDAAFVPRRVVHVPALPRESTGKLTATALRRFALATLAGAATRAAAPTSEISAVAAKAGANAAASESANESASESTNESPSKAAAAHDRVHLVRADHPAFAGHFPGHPLLPGVALLSMVMRSLAEHPALGRRLGARPTIEQVKFLAAVGPGDAVLVSLREHGSGVAFECRVGEGAAARIAARGQLGAGRVA